MGDVIAGQYAYSAWKAATRGEVLPKADYLPTGLGGVEGDPQPGLYKKRDGGGYIDGKKQPHVWVPVKIYLTDDTGAVQHHWRKGLKVCAYVGQNVEADPYKTWLWCQKPASPMGTLNAISQAEYNHWMTHGRWPDDAPETESQPETVADDQVVASTVTDIGTAPAGLGHNSAGDPEGADALVLLLRQHEASIAEWLKIERNGEAAANKAANWLGDLRAVEKRVKDRYKIEKAPILEAERQFKAKWDPVTTLMEAVKARISRAYEGIAGREKERLRQIAEAEARAVAAAHRAKLEAERAAQEAERQREIATAKEAHGLKAEELLPVFREPLPPLPEPAPIVVEPVKVSFGGSTGRKVALKTARHAEIDDWKAAAVHYAMSPRLQEIVQKLATADAKNGIACPGARIVEREVAA